MEFKYELGQTVHIVGGIENAVIIARNTWETLSRPEPAKYYEVRSGDKTFTIGEEEIIEAAEL